MVDILYTLKNMQRLKIISENLALESLITLFHFIGNKIQIDLMSI